MISRHRLKSSIYKARRDHQKRQAHLLDLYETLYPMYEIKDGRLVLRAK